MYGVLSALGLGIEKSKTFVPDERDEEIDVPIYRVEMFCFSYFACQ